MTWTMFTGDARGLERTICFAEGFSGRLGSIERRWFSQNLRSLRKEIDGILHHGPTGCSLGYPLVI